jgi:hypothetical protein
LSEIEERVKKALEFIDRELMDERYRDWVDTGGDVAENIRDILDPPKTKTEPFKPSVTFTVGVTATVCPMDE